MTRGTTTPVVEPTKGALAEVFARVDKIRALGVQGVARRLARRAYDWTGAQALELHMSAGDVLTEVPTDLPVPDVRPARGTRLTVGWVMSPPAAGSGGHTTMLRMVRGLEEQGHRCVLYLYDNQSVDVDRWREHVRTYWPEVSAEIRDARDGFADADAVFASSWATAHVLALHSAEAVRRLYFVQDYEPYFYPRGPAYELAAMTYRLPFRRVALGRMVRNCVRDEQGLECDVVPFGCDTTTYHPPAALTRRSGVVMYCKPGVARRGYLLAAMALKLFHQAHPDQVIHVYGSRPRDLDVPHVFHGSISPRDLNALYGSTVAGLAMSFTNISLVAEEMLAAGLVPVVNDSPEARADLDNPYVRWAEPTARAIADQLGAAVSAPDVARRSSAASASVVGRSWKETQEALVRIVEDEVYGPATPV